MSAFASAPFRRRLQNSRRCSQFTCLTGTKVQILMQLELFDSFRLRAIPPEITEFETLRELYLNDNEISVFPLAMSTLVDLRIFEANKNNLTTIPSAVKFLKQLTRMSLSGNRINKLPQVLSFLALLVQKFKY